MGQTSLSYKNNKKNTDPILSIIQNIQNNLKNINPSFIEIRKIIHECTNPQDNTLYVLIGEQHEKLTQHSEASTFINLIAKIIKNTNTNIPIFLLTEATLVETDESKYWNNIHADISNTLFTKIVKCDIRQKTIRNNILTMFNNQDDINLLKNIDPFFQTTKDFLDVSNNPEVIFTHPPLVSKFYDQETKEYIIDIAKSRLDMNINENNTTTSYKNVVVQKLLNIYKNKPLTYFLSDTINQLLVNENITDNNDEIFRTLQFFINAGMEQKKIFNNDNLQKLIQHIQYYTSVLYGFVLDAEILRNISLINQSKQNKVIIVYAGTEHIRTLDKIVFEKKICKSQDISDIQKSERDDDLTEKKPSKKQRTE